MNYAKFKAGTKNNDKLRNDAGQIGSLFLRNPVFLEHERTPGEVAVMWYEAQGMAGVAQPLPCRRTSYSTDNNAESHCSGSYSRLN